MTSRDRVRRALEFERPDRIPRDLWTLPIARLEHGADAIDSLLRRWPSDFAGLSVGLPDRTALSDGDPYQVGRYRDEWGCVFENIHAGVIGQVKHPLLEDLADLDAVRPPWPTLEVDADAVGRGCRASDHFILAGCCPRPFERAQFLRGSENLLLDLAQRPDAVARLLQIVHDFYRREVAIWAGTAVDGIVFMDDWGGQNGLLISPAQWRRMFKPLYADYVRIAHEGGKKALMHSDGHIDAILEDLVEIGVDAVNSQLFCMDIESIGRRFAGRLTFWGEIDRQHILARGTPADARAAVERVAAALYRPEGGLIAQFELGVSARLANADAIFEAWAAVA